MLSFTFSLVHINADEACCSSYVLLFSVRYMLQCHWIDEQFCQTEIDDVNNVPFLWAQPYDEVFRLDVAKEKPFRMDVLDSTNLSNGFHNVFEHFNAEK
jgi:hypothetical protein